MPPFPHLRRARCLRLALLALPLLALRGHALELDFSGYGTLGYALSDRAYAYQRFIDDGGTFARDSVLGAQVDAALGPQWSATAQVKLAPATDHDSRWQPQLAWAFVSWRPDNDWLLRAGKLRTPTFLNAENLDVGATFDLARLPAEIGTMTPVFDFTGLSIGRSWALAQSELALDGYWGRADTDWRTYIREAVPGVLPAGPYFGPLDIDAAGLVLTWRRPDDTWRIGYHSVRAQRTDGGRYPDAPTRVELAPGIGYYELQPGPDSPSRTVLDIGIFYAGGETALPGGFRLLGEYARRDLKEVVHGIDAQGGYLALSRRSGR